MGGKTLKEMLWGVLSLSQGFSQSSRTIFIHKWDNRNRRTLDSNLRIYRRYIYAKFFVKFLCGVALGFRRHTSVGRNRIRTLFFKVSVEVRIRKKCSCTGSMGVWNERWEHKKPPPDFVFGRGFEEVERGSREERTYSSLSVLNRCSIRWLIMWMMPSRRWIISTAPVRCSVSWSLHLG